MALSFRTFLFTCLLLFSQLSKAEVVIVHPGTDTTLFSANYLRSIFTMRTTRWPDQKPMRVFVLSDKHAVHKSFVKQDLEMFPYQLRMVWDRAAFSGTGYPPIEVVSITEMINQVQKVEGAIGYVDDASKPILKGVEIVEVK